MGLRFSSLTEAKNAMKAFRTSSTAAWYGSCADASSEVAATEAMYAMSPGMSSRLQCLTTALPLGDAPASISVFAQCAALSDICAERRESALKYQLDVGS